MACAPVEVGSEAPVEPLSAELRTELAERRAAGYSWFSIGAATRRKEDALRKAAAADPLFPAAVAAAADPLVPAAVAAARAEAIRDAEAAALERLRLLTNGDDTALALRAAEAMLAFGARCRREETRLAVEKLRAETQRAEIEAKAAKVARAEEAPRPRFVPTPVPTEAEYAEHRERGAVESARKPEYEVYLWGGKHVIGTSQQPDDTDTRVGIYQDYSVNRGPYSILWVVPRVAFEASNRAGGRPITPDDAVSPPAA